MSNKELRMSKQGQHRSRHASRPIPMKGDDRPPALDIPCSTFCGSWLAVPVADNARRKRQNLYCSHRRSRWIRHDVDIGGLRRVSAGADCGPDHPTDWRTAKTIGVNWLRRVSR